MQLRLHWENLQTIYFLKIIVINYFLPTEASYYEFVKRKKNVQKKLVTAKHGFLLSEDKLLISPDCVARLVGCLPAKQEVAGLSPHQGTCLGFGPSPQSGCMQEATNLCFSHTSMFFFCSLSPSPLSKNK